MGEHLSRLLNSLDHITEEESIRIGVGDAGPAYVVDFQGMTDDPEAFSQDKDWMPHLVMIAKNIYVWLDQLSKKYNERITGLDQIPEIELETLARRGFSGLWLIGVWERSSASKKIKQIRGNPEA